MIKKFRKFGFRGPYAGGKHLFMCKESLKVHIPSNHGSDINIGLVNEILKQAGINKEEWDQV